MRLRLLSRASDLAVLQAGLVARALTAHWPDLEIVPATLASAGDRDTNAALWSLEDKGLFTSDLSDALVSGTADAVVHSWKDLPIEPRSGTTIAATLERANPRDVLLIRRDVVESRPGTLTVLSSSPRRAWQLESSLSSLLPWPVEAVRTAPVRGNVPTRLSKLIRGDGDALVVARAALERLLSESAPEAVRASVRTAMDCTRWMVLPIDEHPTAPAQGALAVEIASNRPDVEERVRAISHGPTWAAVERERAILASYGGGCHAAIGATVLEHDFGRVVSVRARMEHAPDQRTWTLETRTPPPPRVASSLIWPRRDERDVATRTALDVPMPADGIGFWVARADALPETWPVTADRLVWAAGTKTWRRLAARGVFVNGCAEGLGDAVAPALDALAGRIVTWRRLTHADAGDPDALATYVVHHPLPADIGARTHFFWSSGQVFRDALAHHPDLAHRWHASGPGRTARVIRDTLPSPSRTSVWLDYDQWHQAVTE
jgi:hydroxymethylbilane synthase